MEMTGKTTNARIAERRAVSAASTMRAEGGRPVDVVVIDLSNTGVRIATSADLAIGQEISIGLAGAGVTHAFVAWRDGERYGCVFERPMAPEATAMAFSNAPVVRLGRAYDVPAEGHDDYLRDLYRRHKMWSVPLDAVAMGAVLIGIAWLVVRHYI
jgi:hypothetical protein